MVKTSGNNLVDAIFCKLFLLAIAIFGIKCLIEIVTYR